jgi:DNA-binding NtrC family response regulator
MLEPEHLRLGGAAQPSSASVVVSGSLEPVRHSSEFPTLADLEKHHIFAALDRCKGNRTHAAKLLDVSIRTLRNKLHEYNGTTPKAEGSPELVEDDF